MQTRTAKLPFRHEIRKQTPFSQAGPGHRFARTARQRRWWTVGLLWLLGAGGCANLLEGSWIREPADEKREGWYLHQVEFRRPNKFYALAHDGEQRIFLSGDYTFTGWRLTLTPAGSREESFDARLWWNRELQLDRPGLTQRMKRQTVSGNAGDRP